MRRLSVVNSRHLVLAKIKKLKKSYKILENAVSDTLLMSVFQMFAADAPRDFFLAPTRKLPYHSQILPENLVGVCCNTM